MFLGIIWHYAIIFKRAFHGERLEQHTDVPCHYAIIFKRASHAKRLATVCHTVGEKLAIPTTDQILQQWQRSLVEYLFLSGCFVKDIFETEAKLLLKSGSICISDFEQRTVWWLDVHFRFAKDAVYNTPAKDVFL
ncbi:hypothetical protein LSTR_LSTR012096 [Laodelphax striatellus]|uniref:Uncharacterized protein n=1 Tax=Laodelphax striatellus TaxID=195883 RepID=A0A482X1Q6_LAOST|nr:hypothetical protein LSTR_LSTR012096 [Laodelphax striatellus]